MVFKYPLRRAEGCARDGKYGTTAVSIKTSNSTAILMCLQIQVQVEARFVSDVLRGHDTTEMRISLIRYIEDEMPPDED